MDVTAKKVCDWKGVTRQTLQTWVSAGLPVKKKGSRGVPSIYDSEQIDEWLVEREISRRVVDSGDDAYDNQKETARLKHHQANNEAIKEAENLGRLLDASLVVDMCSAGVTNCRNRLLSVDKKLRNEFPGLPDEVFDRVFELHEDALNQLGHSGIPRGLQERMAGYLAEREASTEVDS